MPKPVSLVSSKTDIPVATAAVYVHEAMFEDNAYPQYQPGTIVIRTGERVLHYIEDATTMRTYPIAVGREGAQWVGTTKVTHKRKNPDWRPTPNMRKRNPKLPEVVRAGPSNPLGIRAIYLAEGYLRIHGTNDPKSIGKAASSGCYRMHNEHVSELFELVQGGAKVVVLN
jgi:lipoprotein-anchoring transpeptidase ErfK/SrfK